MNFERNYPSFTAEMTAEEKLDRVMDYLYSLKEYLRYLMGNLGAENFNDVELDAITEPVRAQIRDVEGSVTKLEVTADGLAGRMTDAEGNITALDATASGLSSRVADAEGNISTLEQTSQGLSSTVGNLSGQMSTVRQTVTGLEITTSSLESTTNGLSTGTTYIDGGCIRSGTIEGVTLISVMPNTSNTVEIENGTVKFTDGHTLYGELTLGDATGFLTFKSFSDVAIKLSSSKNLSLDAGNGNTVYIGASSAAPNDVTIGQPGRSVSVDAPLRPMRGIVFNTNSYGYSLPGSGTTGQVFYLLEG